MVRWECALIDKLHKCDATENRVLNDADIHIRLFASDSVPK